MEALRINLEYLPNFLNRGCIPTMERSGKGTVPREQEMPHPGLNMEEHFQLQGIVIYLFQKGKKITQVTKVPNESAHGFAGRTRDVRSCSLLVRELLFPWGLAVLICYLLGSSSWLTPISPDLHSSEGKGSRRQGEMNPRVLTLKGGPRLSTAGDVWSARCSWRKSMKGGLWPESSAWYQLQPLEQPDCRVIREDSVVGSAISIP